MIGKIVDVKATGIVLEVNNTGYFINVASPYSFDLDKEEKVYLYIQIREDEHNLFGFKTLGLKFLYSSYMLLNIFPFKYPSYAPYRL